MRTAAKTLVEPSDRPERLLTRASRASIVIAVVFTAAMHVANAATLVGFDEPQRVPGHYIVILKNGPEWQFEPGSKPVRTGDATRDQTAWMERQTAMQRDRQLITSIGSNIAEIHHGTVTHVFETVLRGFSIRAKDSDIRQLASDPRVGAIMPVMRTWTTSPTTQTGVTWGLDRIDQPLMPLNGTYSYTQTGLLTTSLYSGSPSRDVQVYIFDTGVSGSISDLPVGAGLLDATGAGTTGLVVQYSPPSTDCGGHGTMVAGIIGSSIYGVAKGVSINPVQVVNCNGVGNTADLLAAVNYVVAQLGGLEPSNAHPCSTVYNCTSPSIFSFSITTPNVSANTAFVTAINNAINTGITFISSAGNNTGSADSCSWLPSAVPGVIAVSATDNTDRVWSSSDTGTCVTVFAPGVGIQSDWPSGLIASVFGFASTGTNSAMGQGVSLSVPFVAGVAALYLSSYPLAAPAAVKQAIINAATPNVIKGTLNGSPNRLLYSGVSGNPVTSSGGGGGGGSGGGGGGGAGPTAQESAVLVETSILLLE